jgi:hypothetical protein
VDESPKGLPKNRFNISKFIVHSGIPDVYNRWYSWYSSTCVKDLNIYTNGLYLKSKMIKRTYKNNCVVQ